MKYCFWVLVVLVFYGCDSPTPILSEKIREEFQSSGRTFVNLATVLPDPWHKVCILGPYSTTKHAYDTLGFAWPVETQSSISTSDTIALLLFVKNNEVIAFVEHSRRDGDFTNLSRQCFGREQSIFYHQANPPKGWPGLFPKS